MTDRDPNLALPTYKVVQSADDFTPEEATAFHDGDPVAATEFREMATLFVQMHEFVCDAFQYHRGSGVPGWTAEAVHIMNARAQALHDNTRAFTRPLRTR